MASDIMAVRMKIYTKTGDAGETGLFGGQRVSKDDARVEAYGAVDEANSLLGVAAAHLTGDAELHALLLRLQSELFTVGADLATPLERESKAGRSLVPRIEPSHSAALEQMIDHYEQELSPLTAFILPGGTLAAAHLHLARTVARRAERRTVTLSHAAFDSLNPEVIIYLNRLSDLLFTLARVANRRSGVTDILWKR